MKGKYTFLWFGIFACRSPTGWWSERRHEYMDLLISADKATGRRALSLPPRTRSFNRLSYKTLALFLFINFFQDKISTTKITILIKIFVQGTNFTFMRCLLVAVREEAF